MRKTLMLLVSGVLLSGCQNTNIGSKNTQSPAVKSTPSPHTEAAPMSLASSDATQYCSKELSALKKIATKTYQRKSAELNNTLTQASLYMSIKGNISTNTAEIMDSAYKYKISKICNDIRFELTNALVLNAESAAQPLPPSLFSADAQP